MTDWEHFTRKNWIVCLEAYRDGVTDWLPDWGPAPGLPGCAVPTDLLVEYGFEEAPSTDSRATAGEPDGGSDPSMSTSPRPPTWRDRIINAQDLCDKRFPQIKYIVPGLLPEGVTLLASRPKLGKSWLLQQIGSSVALGDGVLLSPADPDKPAHGDVLYLYLEDGQRRAQWRMTKYFGANRSNWPKRMEFVCVWRRLDQGGLDDLREWCKSVDAPTLIMIDTLKRVRSPKRGGQSDYDADYEACQGLLDLCREFPGLAIIVAHHDRKMGADDVFDTVFGTLGLQGGVDANAILKRNGQGVTLHIKSRDLDDDVDKAVRFDRETCRWVILGEAIDVHRSEGRTAILEVLAGAPSEGMSAQAIMGAAGIRSQDAGWQLLHRMAKTGEIERRARGKYSLPLSGPSGMSGTAQATDPARENTDPDDPDTLDKGRSGPKPAVAEPHQDAKHALWSEDIDL